MTSAGSVGGIVAGCSGYGGYIPSSEIQPVPAKAGLQQHISVECRTSSSQRRYASHEVHDLQHDKGNLLLAGRTGSVYADTFVPTDSMKSCHVPAYRIDKSPEDAPPPAKFVAKSTYHATFDIEDGNESGPPPVRRTCMPPQAHAININRMKSASECMQFAMQAMDLSSSYRKDFGARGENPSLHMPKDAIDAIHTSTTVDFSVGTSKLADHVSNGYCGYLPKNPRNSSQVHGYEKDPLLQHHKDSLTFTSRLNLPGYSGHVPTSVKNDIHERGVDTSLSTTGRTYCAHTKSFTTSRTTRKNAIHSFFTGPPSASHTETFYKSVRPGEGMLTFGSPSSQKLSKDSEILRSHMYSNF